MSVTQLSRRERTRAATVAEIKDQALRQMTADGVAALSLREIARQMGMTSSALYRYFASREQLISVLIVDARAALADELEAAAVRADSGSRRSALRKWRDVTRAYRSWALENPTAYTLIYGAPVPGYEAPPDCGTEEMARGTAVLFGIMVEAMNAGELDPGLQPVRNSSVRRLMREWAAIEGVSLSPAAMQVCHAAWSQLQGAVAVELYGNTPPALRGSVELFDNQMAMILAGVRVS